MKKILLVVTLSFFFFGCNMNPNKEARLQKLETEIQQSNDKIKELENKVQTLESMNEQLKTRILVLEKKQKLLASTNNKIFENQSKKS